MKSVLLSIRLYYFYLTYKGLKTEEIRKKFPFNFKGKIYEYVSKTNWKQDLMKIPQKEREFFKQFVGKIGLCFYCDNVEEIKEYKFPRWYGEAECDESDFYYLESQPYEERRYDGLKKSTCLNEEELYEYLDHGKKQGYAIHISQLEIFDEPKELCDFSPSCENYKKCPAIGCVYCDRNYLTKAPQSWQYVEVEE